MRQQDSVCPEVKLLMAYVCEELEEQHEQVVFDHVDECESCRQQLESLAVGELDWARVQAGLREHTASFEQPPGEQSASPVDRDVARLIELLGPTDNPEMLGRIAGYEVVGLVGRGATGIVVKALDTRLNRFVAIKILSPTYANSGPARRRFERESRAVAAVAHEHVVPIHSVSEYQGLPFIVMQYISGGSLQTRIAQDGPLGSCEVVRIGMQIAKGLAAAHAQGIVHRDVKPANVMLEPKVDRAMVSDFGLARVADDATLTRSGVVAGTPQFMSPEQARGEPVDGRSDLFSLGSTLYAACTGRPPFRADSIFGVIKKVCEGQPREIRELNPGIDPILAAFIDKLLEKDPQDRFQTADEVARILSDELSHMQSPAVTPAPLRPWFQPAASEINSLPMNRVTAFVPIAAVLLALTSWMTLSFWPSIAGPDASSQPTGKDVVPQIGLGQMGERERAAASHLEQQPLRYRQRVEERLVHEGFRRFDMTKSQSFDVKADGTLRMNVDLGDVHVQRGDVSQVRVEAVSSVLAMDEKQADEWLRLFTLSRSFEDGESVEGRDASLIAKWPDPSREIVDSTSSEPSHDQTFRELRELRQVRYDVTIPEQFNLDLSIQSGDFQCAPVNANVKVRCDSGNCVLHDVGGTLDATTISGFVQADDVGDDAHIDAGGPVRIGNVAGMLFVQAKGQVHTGRIGSALEIVTTGGEIRLERAGGPADVRTVGGAIVVESAHGAVQATTGGGQIDVTFAKQPIHASRLHTDSGPITLGVAPTVSLEILASAPIGGVISEFPASASGAHEDHGKEWFVINGGDQLVQAETGAGSVEIKRVKATSP